ncbi:unnamed protein product, partial [marine sediment metagenome]
IIYLIRPYFEKRKQAKSIMADGAAETNEEAAGETEAPEESEKE